MAGDSADPVSGDFSAAVTVVGNRESKTFPLQDNEESFQPLIRYLGPDPIRTGLLYLSWNDNDLEEMSWMKERLDAQLSGSIQVCRLEKWLRLIMPVLSDYQWPEVEKIIFPELNSGSGPGLYIAFYRMLERFAQIDLQALNAFSELFSGKGDAEYQLIVRIAEYRKEHSIEVFRYPPLPVLRMPVNFIGTDQWPDNDGESGEESMISQIRSWFGKNGKLENGLSGYELRTEQIELASVIGEAFENASFLLAEAGTGTGKSLAYLIPAYLFATEPRNSGETVVISTHTKNLQDQLFYKDLPLMQSLAGRPFSAVLLKGRSNYICRHRWNQILSEPSYHLSPYERDAVLPVLFWQLYTLTGDISECTSLPEGLSRFIWDKACSDKRYCLNQRCHFFEQCYVKKIRDLARRSHLTIINHSLLFSDINAESSILGPYHHLVIDEAHQLEKVAQQYLGLEFTLWGMKAYLGHLYERDRFETGLFIQLRAQLQKAGLAQVRRKRLEELIGQATDACVQTWIQVQSWFQQVTVRLSAGNRQNGSREKNHAGRKKIRYRGDLPSWTEISDLNDLWVEPAERLLLSLRNMMTALQSAFMKDLGLSADFQMQVKSRYEELEELIHHFHVLMKAEEEEFVFWYELPQSDRSYDVRFYGVPLNIADKLREVLYERLKTCVFSSATLSVAGKFDYYKSRAGLGDHAGLSVSEYAAGSPFDFSRQSRLIIPSYLPDPAHESFPGHIAEMIRRIAVTHRRGTLVLFTSYQMMRQCYDMLHESMKREKIVLLMQGQDSSRTALTHRFRQDVSSVLFGTDSFWEGVDVPGEALEMLIITKLPFEVPSDPLVAAKLERIETNGGNPFYDYSLPEAVIKFRQGFGRLIRHKNDKGVILLSDNRLVCKSYGKWFLKSLPAESRVVKTEDGLNEAIGTFFGNHQKPSA